MNFPTSSLIWTSFLPSFLFPKQLLQDHTIRLHYYPQILVDAFQVHWNPSVVCGCKCLASRSGKCCVLSSANVAYWLHIYSVRFLLVLFHSSKFKGEPSSLVRYTGNRALSAGRMATLTPKRAGEHKERWRIINIRLFLSLCSLYHYVYPNKHPRYAVRKFEPMHRSIWHSVLLGIATGFKRNLALLPHETTLCD
jgi:hypothetical protein